MTSIEKAEAEFRGLTLEHKSCERELRELQRLRPGPALEAQRGNGAALAALDASIAKLERKKMDLEDALTAARKQIRVARAEEMLPALDEYHKALGLAKSGLGHMLAGLRQSIYAYDQLMERAKTSQAHIPLPGRVNEIFTLAVAEAAGLGGEISFTRPAASVDDVLDDVKAGIQQIKTIREAVAKKPMASRLQDQATGVLGWMGAVNRRAS